MGFVIIMFCLSHFRCCFLYAHCWLIQILMTHLFRKLLICTKLTGPSMRPLLAAGPRSMPWADLCLDILYIEEWMASMNTFVGLLFSSCFRGWDYVSVMRDREGRCLNLIKKITMFNHCDVLSWCKRMNRMLFVSWLCCNFLYRVM